jgi:hypothetical protein
MAQIWRLYGPNMATIWPKYGDYMAQIWRIYGPNLAQIWHPKYVESGHIEPSVCSNSLPKSLYDAA